MKVIHLEDAMLRFAADRRAATRYKELCERYPSTGPDPDLGVQEERARLFLRLREDLKGMLACGDLYARGYWARDDNKPAEPPAAWWTNAKVDIGQNTASADYEIIKGIQIKQSRRRSDRRKPKPSQDEGQPRAARARRGERASAEAKRRRGKSGARRDRRHKPARDHGVARPPGEIPLPARQATDDKINRASDLDLPKLPKSQ